MKITCPNCQHEFDLTREQAASIMGASKSRAKRASSARNGKLGGRPKKQKPVGETPTEK